MVYAKLSTSQQIICLIEFKTKENVMDNKKNGIPKLRFPGFTGAWEQRKLSSMTQYKNGKGHEDLVDRNDGD